MIVTILAALVVIYVVLTIVNLRLNRPVSGEFIRFFDEQAAWSQRTFGWDWARGPIGPLRHLIKEVDESIMAVEIANNNIHNQALSLADNQNPMIKALHMEIIDCFFLVIDAARRAGISSAGMFLSLAFEKLEINKKRKWQMPKPGEPVEHVREGDFDKG